jgi:uncharacterized damage-inducible protein DinB
MIKQPYSHLVRCKQWADGELHRVVTNQIDQLDSFENSIIMRVLDHIHVVDRIFQHHLQGIAHPFRAPRSDVIPEFATLANNTRQVDDWYVCYVETLPPQDFDQPVDFTYTNGTPMRMTRGEIILHVCQHGTYHRGNAGILFQKNGIEPGRDAITDYLEATALSPTPAPASR